MQRLLPKLFLALLAVGGANAFVNSCEETKNHLVNSNLHAHNTTYACVIVQEGFTDWDQLALLAAVSGETVHYFDKIANDPTRCVSKPANQMWKVTGLDGLQKECPEGAEFTLIFTSELDGGIFVPLKKVNNLDLGHESATLVVPQTGIKIRKLSCTGTGIVTIYGGIGDSVHEQKFELLSYSCPNLPDFIFTFDSVITIAANTLSFQFEFTSDLDSKAIASHGDNIMVYTTGRADDLQNVLGGLKHIARIEISNGDTAQVTANMQLAFDAQNDGAVVLKKVANGPTVDYYNGTYAERFDTQSFEVQYVPKRKQPSDIGQSNDAIFVDINVVSDVYCNCAVDSSGVANGWKSNEIWLDMVVVLDTSEAMGAEALDKAQTLLHSFISDGVVDFLTTDTTAPYYTRIGVISMTETVEVIYNLNMTKADKVQVSITKGLPNIDILNAFYAASNMLSEGAKSSPLRSNARQVIYYMTDSDPKSIPEELDWFKENGVIIVNNFLKEGEESNRAGLIMLASRGFCYYSTSYLSELQSFCKANCFCRSDKFAYSNLDAATQASGGCYTQGFGGLSFANANAACAMDRQGFIATIHDADKAEFVQDMLSNIKSSYFWIGYAKSNEGVWQWEDQSADPYTNWDVNEPSSSSVAKCAYVDSTNAKLPWGAGNCNIAFPFVCQSAPCSVGNEHCT